MGLSTGRENHGHVTGGKGLEATGDAQVGGRKECPPPSEAGWSRRPGLHVPVPRPEQRGGHSKLIIEKHRRVAAILLSDPEALKEYAAKDL